MASLSFVSNLVFWMDVSMEYYNWILFINGVILIAEYLLP